MVDIKGKDLRFTIKAVIDLPASEPESLGEWLEHLREVGVAEIVSVEVVEPGTPLPDIRVGRRTSEHLE